VFNAATSSQPPDVTLALLKDAVKRYDIKEVYFETSASLALDVEDCKERTDLTGVYIASDYMPLSFNKIGLLLHASSSAHYLNNFFPARRYWDSILDFDTIATIVKQKNTDEYRHFGHELSRREHLWYEHKGFIGSDEHVEDHMYFTDDGQQIIDTEAISADWKRYVIELIDYCQAQGVKLKFFSTPVSRFQLVSFVNYDDYIAFIHEICDERGIEYTDFNLLKEDWFSNSQALFRDSNHLNSYGAEVFSGIFSQYMNGTLPDDAFYASAEEKIRTAPPDFCGVSYQDDDETRVRTIRLIASPLGYYEFRVELDENGKKSLLQDYDINEYFVLPYEQVFLDSGEGLEVRPKIIVTYRPVGSDEVGKTLTYQYEIE